MDENISIAPLAKDGDKLLSALGPGRMVVSRSKNDFLYITDSKEEFQLFMHTSGSPSGGRHMFPKDEKYTAVIRNLATVADTLFAVEFDKRLDLYGVMASAEDGILSMFPGDDRDADEDVEFIIPGTEDSSSGGEPRELPE